MPARVKAPHEYPNWKQAKGPHVIEYIEDSGNRRKKRNYRRRTLFQKGFELHKISRAEVFILINDENDQRWVYSSSDELYRQYSTTGIKQAEAEKRCDGDSNILSFNKPPKRTVNRSVEIPTPTKKSKHALEFSAVSEVTEDLLPETSTETDSVIEYEVQGDLLQLAIQVGLETPRHQSTACPTTSTPSETLSEGSIAPTEGIIQIKPGPIIPNITQPVVQAGDDTDEEMYTAATDLLSLEIVHVDEKNIHDDNQIEGGMEESITKECTNGKDITSQPTNQPIAPKRAQNKDAKSLDEKDMNGMEENIPKHMEENITCTEGIKENIAQNQDKKGGGSKVKMPARAFYSSKLQENRKGRPLKPTLKSPLRPRNVRTSLFQSPIKSPINRRQSMRPKNLRGTFQRTFQIVKGSEKKTKTVKKENLK